MPRFAANLTMMYNEHAFLDRFVAAARDGFNAVEFLFPYEFRAGELKARLDAHGLTQALFNAPPGDWKGGERGLASLPGREDEFLAAMEQAKALIAASPWFVSLRVERCVERPNGFLLLVEWERLEDHTEGFRGSPAYEQWRGALHHFYDPFPTVEHYDVVATA